MSFFELDGGAKKRKSTKPKATKKSPAKKSSGKKKTKKGGNFLGTVSELFAPAGWENFVTAAGLLALDRTDNYIRKSKDSKKQRGGADDDTPKMEENESFTSRMSGGARKRSSSRRHRGGNDDDTPKMEEEMSGGARKRSSSRKQRGGSDGHHTVEYLDAVGGEDDMTPDTTSQTGGGKKRPKSKGKERKHKGGAMNEEEKKSFLRTYHREPEEAKKLIQIYDTMNKSNISNNNSKTNIIINRVIERHSQNLTLPSEPNNLNQSMQQQAMQQQANAQQANTQPANTQPASLFNNTGGKPKSKSKSKSSSKKSKSSTKKPKAKKTKERK